MAIQYVRLPFRILDAVSPRLSAALALKVFTTPRRWPMPKWEQDIAERAEKIRLSTGHEGMSWGSGKPVLLVHGWEGRVTQLGHFIEPLVQRGYRVIGFNAPAHGGSAGKALNVLQYAQFLRVVVMEYGPMHGVIAHSMGASAFGFATRLPLAVDRAVLLSTANSVGGVALWFEDMVGLSPRARAIFRERLEREVFHTPLAGLSLSEHVPPYLPRTLLMATNDDRDVPMSDTRLLAARWPNARMTLAFNAGGHRKLLRDDRVIDAAITFLTEKVQREQFVRPPHRSRAPLAAVAASPRAEHVEHAY